MRQLPRWIRRSKCLAAAALLPALAAAEGRPAAAPGGVTVDQLVGLALKRNAALLASRQRLAEAQGLLRQAGLRPNPAIDFAVSNGDVLGSPGEREFSLGYSHIFELGAKRDRRVDAARLQTELAGLEAADRERLLRAGVKTRYAEALAALRNLENAERLLNLTRQSYRLAEARTRAGEGAPLEQGLLEVEVNRIDSDRMLFAGQAERALLEVKLETGLPLDDPLRLDGSLASPSEFPAVERALELAFQRRPDLAAARLEEALSDAELRLAQAGAAPDLVATGRYAHSQSRFDAYGFSQPGGRLIPLRDRDNLLTAGISISLPVRNRNQGNIEAAVARQRAARLRREFVERTVRQEVLAALSRGRAAAEALAVFDRRVIGQAQENLRVIRGAYELGELRLLDVINEQRRLLDTQRAHTDLLRGSYLAAVEVERAINAPLGQEVQP